jgi:hypothetical protein
MMRSGRLLAEESPENLLKNYGLPTLEEVFLKLCMRDGSYKVKDAVVNAPIPKEKSYTTSQNHLGGHENMAFNYSISQFDVSQVGVERQENIKSHPGSLAHYNVVSKFCDLQGCICKHEHPTDLSLLVLIYSQLRNQLCRSMGMGSSV